MVMHARKHPRLSDGYFERNSAHPYEGSTRYSKSPFGEGCNDKSPANENALCNDSPDSRPSPRYYNKSSYSQRLKEREREHMDSSSIKSPLPKDRNNRSREHQTSSNSSSSSLSRKGFDGPLGTATSSNPSSRTNHDRGSHPEEKEKRLQVGEWSEHVSSSGKKYYYNCRTEVSQWEKPREWIEWEKHQGIYKPLESNRTKGSSSSKSSEKHSNSSSAAGGSGGSSSAVSSNPNSVSASFRGSQSHHSSSHGQPQQSSTGRQASSSHALQSSGGSSSSSASSGGRGGRPAPSEEHHSSSSSTHPHHHSSHHQHHNSNNAHHQSHSTSSASSSSHHHGRGGHEDHHQVGSTFSSSENRSNTSNSLDHRHHHHSGSRRSESLKSREDSQAQDMDISPDTSEAGHHSQQENSRPHLSHQQTPHGQHSNEQGSHHQQRAQCRTPTSKGSSSSSLATAQLLSPSQVTLANLPKLISQMAGTKGLPNLKELSPEEALQTIQQALQLTKQLGGLNRSPHGASLIVSDHQHKVSAVSPIVSQSQSQPQQQQQTNSTSNTNNNSNNNNCSLSSGGSHGLPPFVPSHGDGKDGGGASPVSECNTHSSRQASPTSSVSSLPSLPAAGSSSLASLKPVTPSLTPSLANYFREDLIGHVTGWQADHAERQASRYSEEAHSIGSLNCTRVSAELKMARSLVRLAEIQATLQEQRILFLRQQVKELEDRRSQNSFISDT